MNWISVQDRLPKNHQEVLLWCGEAVIGYLNFGSSWCVYNNGDYNYGGYGDDYKTVDKPKEYAPYPHPTHWAEIIPPEGA